MSAHRVVEIRCDGPGDRPCPEAAAFAGTGGQAAARDDLRIHRGWMHWGADVDRCAVCTGEALAVERSRAAAREALRQSLAVALGPATSAVAGAPEAPSKDLQERTEEDR